MLDWETRILMTCAQLHNFIIKEDRQFEKHFHTVEEEIDGINLIPDPIAPLEMSSPSCSGQNVGGLSWSIPY